MYLQDLNYYDIYLIASGMNDNGNFIFFRDVLNPNDQIIDDLPILDPSELNSEVINYLKNYKEYLEKVGVISIIILPQLQGLQFYLQKNNYYHLQNLWKIEQELKLLMT